MTEGPIYTSEGTFYFLQFHSHNAAMSRYLWLLQMSYPICSRQPPLSLFTLDAGSSCTLKSPEEESEGHLQACLGIEDYCSWILQAQRAL